MLARSRYGGEDDERSRAAVLVVPRVLHGVRLGELALGLMVDRYGAALRAAEASPVTPFARRMLESHLGDADAQSASRSG